ncbi:Uncharacterised protein [Bordetella ansorpii]|uniref:Lipoprotein n=1 Tax=Bordetella ansorpii TaxID=288768 RepID=A0A157S598_9BORD|nr:hypothetical protein [Bordetella ansorpii]SAI65598.1 Uncharacterised protein [Bordetella ansorpii]
MRMPYRMCALVLAVSAALSACGGGGDDDDKNSGGTTPPVTTPETPSDGKVTGSISGTVASGLAMIGTVTVKDALGVTKTVDIGENGSYEVDVTGMTAPFVFRAEGTVGGRRTILHSAAIAADARGTINITQLTDLIVANIAGQLAANYFDAGNFGTLSVDELNAEVAGLKAKLLPVLQAMGVEDSIDLLRTSFTPQSSALDKALDVLSINYADGVASITNLVTQQKIEDALLTKAAQEANAPALPATGMDTAAADIDAIRAMLVNFNNLFATNAPSAQAIRAFLVEGEGSGRKYSFRHQDENADRFASELASDPALVGGHFVDVAFNRINYTINDDNLAPRAWIDFTHKDKNGVIFSVQENFQVVKGADNVWRMRGNSSVLAVDAVALNVKVGGSGCVSTGLEFNIEEVNPNNSGDTAYVLVTGPGLPTGGLKYLRANVNGDYWTLSGQGNLDGTRYYRMATSCMNTPSAGLTDAAIQAIPANAVYTVTGYTSADVASLITDSTFPVTASRRVARPLTLTEARAAAFPLVTTSSPLASYNGGTMTVSATGLNPAVATSIALSLAGTSGYQYEDQDVSTATDGTASAVFNLSASDLGTIQYREARVGTTDDVFRELLTTTSVMTPVSVE